MKLSPQNTTLCWKPVCRSSNYRMTDVTSSASEVFVVGSVNTILAIWQRSVLEMCSFISLNFTELNGSTSKCLTVKENTFTGHFNRNSAWNLFRYSNCPVLANMFHCSWKDVEIGVLVFCCSLSTGGFAIKWILRCFSVHHRCKEPPCTSLAILLSSQLWTRSFYPQNCC